MSIIYHRGAALLSSSSSSFCNNCPKSKPTKPYLSLSFFASSAVKALSIMSSYDRELSAAKKAASLASRLCQVSPKPTHPHPNPTAPPHPPPHPPPQQQNKAISVERRERSAAFTFNWVLFNCHNWIIFCDTYK